MARLPPFFALRALEAGGFTTQRTDPVWLYKAFKENISKEVSAGKPIKQAVAIAYATKRAAASKKTTSKSKGKQK